MRNVFLILLAAIIAGCSQSEPVSVKGKYYLIGDANCINITQSPEQEDSGIVSCYTYDNEYTEDRHAMTDQDMQMWIYKKQKSEMQAMQVQQQIQMQQMQRRQVQSRCAYEGPVINCYSY